MNFNTDNSNYAKFLPENSSEFHLAEISETVEEITDLLFWGVRENYGLYGENKGTFTESDFRKLKGVYNRIQKTLDKFFDLGNTFGNNKFWCHLQNGYNDDILLREFLVKTIFKKVVSESAVRECQKIEKPTWDKGIFSGIKTHKI